MGLKRPRGPGPFPRRPHLDPATSFTSEDFVVHVSIAPGAAEVPGQPRLPGGKCRLLRAWHGARGRWRELGLEAYTLHLTWDLGQASVLSNLVLLVCKTKGIGQTSDIRALLPQSISFSSNHGHRVHRHCTWSMP